MKDFEKDTVSKFEQTANQIVLKVDSKGNIVEVGLYGDADKGTEFKVKANNIELSADEVISLLSGGTINLSAGEGITIESPYFSVDKDSVTIGKDGKTVIKDGELTTGSVTADAIASEAITAEKIATDAVTADAIAAGSITSDEIASKTITSENIDTDELFSKEITAYNLNVKGGKIDMQTVSSDVDVESQISIAHISATNYSAGGHDIKFVGLGEPSNYLQVAAGELYLDILTGYVYANTNSNTSWIHVTSITGAYALDEITFNAKDGISITKSTGEFGKGEPEVIWSTNIGNIYTELFSICCERSQVKQLLTFGDSDDVGSSDAYIYDSDGTVTFNLKGGNLENANLNKLQIGGKTLVTGSVVWDLSQETSISTRQNISAPGIDNTMPCGVINGDYDAQPGLNVTSCGVVPSSEYITFVMEGCDKNTLMRFTYWYFAAE